MCKEGECGEKDVAQSKNVMQMQMQGITRTVESNCELCSSTSRSYIAMLNTCNKLF